MHLTFLFLQFDMMEGNDTLPFAQFLTILTHRVGLAFILPYSRKHCGEHEATV